MMAKSHDAEQKRMPLREREDEENRLNASIDNICRLEPVPNANFGESDLELIVNPDDKLSDQEAEERAST